MRLWMAPGAEAGGPSSGLAVRPAKMLRGNAAGGTTAAGADAVAAGAAVERGEQPPPLRIDAGGIAQELEVELLGKGEVRQGQRIELGDLRARGRLDHIGRRCAGRRHR